jgi:hypothetical protein
MMGASPIAARDRQGRAAVAVGTGDQVIDALDAALRGLDGDSPSPERPPGHLGLGKAIAAACGGRDPASASVLVKRGAKASPELADAVIARLAELGFAEVQLLETGGPQVPFRYGPTIGEHRVARAWLEADARVIVGAAAADRQLLYAGAIVAALGCVPDSAQLSRTIASARGLARAACEILDRLPVAFGVLAGTGSAATHAVIASPDLLALDWVLGEVIGLDGPGLSPAVAAMVEQRGPIELDRRGELTEWDLGCWHPSVPGPARAALADLGAGRLYGRLLGAKEVPWTDR